jgi:hypothetical protein
LDWSMVYGHRTLGRTVFRGRLVLHCFDNVILGLFQKSEDARGNFSLAQSSLFESD